MAPTATSSLELVDIPIGKVEPDPNNPRKHIDVDDDFVSSIKESGILQPITVVPIDGKDDRWRIAFGERRWTGAKAAGLKQVPCVIRRDLDAVTIFENQVVENVQRKSLRPLEEANAYHQLLHDHKVPQRELAPRLGCSQSHLSKMSRLVKLAGTGADDLLDSGRITVSTAVELATIADDEKAFAKAVKRLQNVDNPSIAARIAEEEVGAVKRARARAKVVAELEAKGVKVIDRGDDWGYGGPEGRRLGKGWNCVDMAPSKHAKLDCHAVVVDRLAETYAICTDSRAHTAPPDPSVEQERAKRSADTAAREADEEARRERRRSIVAEQLPRIGAGDIAELLPSLVERVASAPACDALGIEVDYRGVPSWNRSTAAKAPLRAYASVSIDNAVRAAAAVILAGGENALDGGGGEVDTYLDWLVRHGYEPSDDEILVAQPEPIEVEAGGGSCDLNSYCAICGGPVGMTDGAPEITVEHPAWNFDAPCIPCFDAVKAGRPVVVPPTQEALDRLSGAAARQAAADRLQKAVDAYTKAVDKSAEKPTKGNVAKATAAVGALFGEVAAQHPNAGSAADALAGVLEDPDTFDESGRIHDDALIGVLAIVAVDDVVSLPDDLLDSWTDGSRPLHKPDVEALWNAFGAAGGED